MVWNDTPDTTKIKTKIQAWIKHFQTLNDQFYRVAIVEAISIQNGQK